MSSDQLFSVECLILVEHGQRNEMEFPDMADREVVASGFRKAMAGKMDDGLIDAAVASQLAARSGFQVSGWVESVVFFLGFQVKIPNEKNFAGKAGGLSVPTIGYFEGRLITDDLDRLYRDTANFMFELAPGYTALQFFDSRSSHLGTVHAGTVALTALFGIGGGTGTWSNP